jgi:hypothetical protein
MKINLNNFVFSLNSFAIYTKIMYRYLNRSDNSYFICLLQNNVNAISFFFI